MLSWHYLTSTAYNAASASEKTSDKLFYLSDTRQIYRGTELFTEAVRLVTSWPTSGIAVGVIYVHKTTLEGKVYTSATDTTGTTVIQPIQAAIDDSNKANAKTPASTKAVHDYVMGAFDNASYTKGGTITFGNIDDTDDTLVITDLPVDLIYDKDSGLLKLKGQDGAAVGTGINLDLERFVKSGSYDAEKEVITLVFNDDDDPVEIPVAGLVDTYTANNTGNDVLVTVSGYEISAKLSEEITKAIADNAQNIINVAKDLEALETDLMDAMDERLASVDSNIEALQGQVSTNASNISKNATAISNEKTRAEGIEAGLRTDINTATAALTWKTTV